MKKKSTIALFVIHRCRRSLKMLGSLSVILLLTGSLFSASAQDDVPEKVLFVGNSYTYFWNLPQQVHVLSESQDTGIMTAQSTSGGTNWGQHWRGERDIQSRDLIANGDFDAVVLQNHSMRSFDAPDSLMHYGKLFADLIKEQDAQVYVYMTWAREWNPLMQDTITEAYMNLAKEIDATVVPVGLAWQKARQLRPDLKLFAEDGSHPSNLGTYLTACVFYKVFTGAHLQGLPERLLTTDADGQKLYLNILSEENAIFLQQVAEEVVNSFNAQTES